MEGREGGGKGGWERGKKGREEGWKDGREGRREGRRGGVYFNIQKPRQGQTVKGYSK